jgi:mannitol/fructose-specific phosphotransferase system IIA component (Ntr-type)
MRVSDAVSGAPIVHPAWKTFDEAIERLVERLVEAGSLPASLAANAVARVREREAITGTAMVDIGVSIPHARVEGVKHIAATIAVSPTAVYELADGLPISIVVLVLSSPTLIGEHLNFLSSVSMLLQSGALREALRNAHTSEEVLRIVRENESRGR